MVAPTGDSSGDSSSVVPILALTTLIALLILGLGLGLVPSTAVHRPRMSAAVEEHHDQFTLAGALLLSVAVALALTLLTK